MKVTRKQLIAARQQLLEEYNIWSHLVGVDDYECTSRDKKIKKITKILN